MKKIFFIGFLVLSVFSLFADDGIPVFEGEGAFGDNSAQSAQDEQEYDERFYRSARFFSIGANIGYEGFTQQQATLFTPNLAYGFKGSFFFDFHIAAELQLNFADHNFDYVEGSEKITSVSKNTNAALYLKFFFNTYNLPAAITFCNPHILAGFGHIWNKLEVDGLSTVEKTWSFNGGVGLEFPIWKEKVFLGITGLYHYTNFPYESNPNDFFAPLTYSGDTFSIMASFVYYYF